MAAFAEAHPKELGPPGRLPAALVILSRPRQERCREDLEAERARLYMGIA